MFHCGPQKSDEPREINEVAVGPVVRKNVIEQSNQLNSRETIAKW